MARITYVPMGLNIEEVNQRFTLGKCNIKKQDNLKTNWEIISSNLFTFFNMILTLLAGLLFIVNSYLNMWFIIIAAINTGIGIFQEFKARATVKNLSLIKESKITVIRQGMHVEILIEDIVLDDLVLYKAGKQVVADSFVENGELSVSEANITGESKMVRKIVGDKLFSGSYVISGQAYCKVMAVGEDNYIDTLRMEASTLDKPNSVILDTLKWILKFVGIIIIPFGLMTFYNIYNNSVVAYDYIPDFIANSVEFKNAVTKMAGSMVAMVPSGLVLLTTMTFAASVIKLGKSNTLVQELYSIETIARVDVLCLDKTGTITDGTMKVDDFVLLHQFSEHKYRRSDIKNIVASMNFALDDNNQTAKALNDYFEKEERIKATKVIHFNSANKYSLVNLRIGGFVLGAPEIIYRGQYKLIKELVEAYAKQGKRVLLLAEIDKIVKEKFSGKARGIALIVINDTIRENAPATIQKFIESNVTVKVISGDNALTVSEVSRRAGVMGADKYISMDTVHDDDIERIANEYNVFGRVTPEQKKTLVIALQDNNHKVCMIGDGVNDILALKQADVSVSLRSATEATRNISHIVLLDDDFSNLPKVVKEGRQIVCNLEKTSILFLTKTLFTILLTISVLLLAKSYPFEPIHMFVIETFIVGIPTFFLALESHTKMFKGKFFKNIMKKIVPNSILLLLNVLAVMLFSDYFFNFTSIQITTISILSVSFAYWLILALSSLPMNLLRKGLIAFAFVSSILFLIISKELFPAHELPLTGLLVLLVLMETDYIILSISQGNFLKFNTKDSI
ncbi:MAG: HAD-IC family P-type ATPase [Tenericutes bacterium]|nr:HAD-IC family P-type ATPase [Mycoplasmatota bacterium]